MEFSSADLKNLWKNLFILVYSMSQKRKNWDMKEGKEERNQQIHERMKSVTFEEKNTSIELYVFIYPPYDVVLVAPAELHAYGSNSFGSRAVRICYNRFQLADVKLHA